MHTVVGKMKLLGRSEGVRAKSVWACPWPYGSGGGKDEVVARDWRRGSGWWVRRKTDIKSESNCARRMVARGGRGQRGH